MMGGGGGYGNETIDLFWFKTMEELQ